MMTTIRRAVLSGPIILVLLLALGTSVVFGHPGEPDNIWTGGVPVACPDIYQPVHDEVGTTYGNECQAAMVGVFETWDGVGHALPFTVVQIDIKPGSDPNCFNNDGHGVIPVAILASASFDAAQVVPESVELEGLSVAARGHGSKLLASIEDVNGDGLDDLVVKIEDTDGAFAAGAGTATLTGSLVDGTLIEGSDTICVVP